MSWHVIERDGVALHGRDVGDGLPVIFQHGLGADESQVAEVFPGGEGWRRLTLDCRAQGRSPPGDPARFSINTFADDVLGFADARGVDRFVIGGISMGAAIALSIAARHPERVSALMLARPAWLWDPAPENLRPYAEVADNLFDADPVAARQRFAQTPTAQRLGQEAPDNLASLLRYFDVSDRAMTAKLLAAIASDGPGVGEGEARLIGVPTLLIGNAVDAAHPLAFARILAATLPRAELVEITPKAVDRPRYLTEFRAALAAFLATIDISAGAPP